MCKTPQKLSGRCGTLSLAGIYYPARLLSGSQVNASRDRTAPSSLLLLDIFRAVRDYELLVQREKQLWEFLLSLKLSSFSFAVTPFS